MTSARVFMCVCTSSPKDKYVELVCMCVVCEGVWEGVNETKQIAAACVHVSVCGKHKVTFHEFTVTQRCSLCHEVNYRGIV